MLLIEKILNIKKTVSLIMLEHFSIPKSFKQTKLRFEGRNYLLGPGEHFKELDL
jgi:hypothetical protein